MIKTLHISNYALINHIEIALEPGLNIITGETGAGKSIILGALSLLLGERVDTKSVRFPDARSVIEAEFQIAAIPALKTLCAENDIEWIDGSVVLRREIMPNGRSRAFVNDTLTTLGVLKEASALLVDIHSQHQNLSLADEAFQLAVVDAMAGNADVRAEFDRAFSDFRVALTAYRHEKKKIEDARKDEEYLRFQFSRLDEAQLTEGEIEALEREQQVLSRIEQLGQSLAIAVDALAGNDTNAVDLLQTAYAEADRLTRYMPEAEGLLARLDSLRIQLRDLASEFEDLAENLSADPHRLEYVDERLNLLYDLRRRFNLETTEQLIALRDEIHDKLMAIEHSDSRLHELEIAAKRAKKVTMECAARLSASRREQASRLGALWQQQAAPLGMQNLKVDIAVEPAQLTATGIDSVSFRFSFNKNQPLMPVGGTASGGEISRLMLVLKSILANRLSLPTVIFDEIDTGVSGDVANRMGNLMLEIAAGLQVIAITHLPQVAAKGTTHFKVYKHDTDTATNTLIRRLEPMERVDELALMLSGDESNSAARATARGMLADAGNVIEESV